MGIRAYAIVGFFIISLLSTQYAFAQFAGCGPDEVRNVEGECVSAFADEPSVGTLSVKTDRSSYNDGDIIRISGNVGTLNENYEVVITLMLLDPEGNIVTMSQILPDSSGAFSKTIEAGGPLWELTGDYEIRAQYGTQKSSTTFYFVAGSSSFLITVSVDRDSYDKGDIVKVFGKTIGTSGGYVTVQIREVDIYRNFPVVLTSQPSLRSDGSYEYTFDPEIWLKKAGNYNVKATYGSEPLDAQTAFEYTGITSSGSSSISISTDKSSYTDGDTIRISGNVGDLNAYSLVAVTMFMFDPIGETMTVAQVIPLTDGSFHFTVKAGGIMQISGDYTITAQYGSKKSTTTFSFSAGGFTPTTTPFDTVPPLILVPSDITIDATDSSGARVDYSVKAIDDEDGVLRPNCSPSSGSLFFIGETTVACSATDNSGNSARKSFLITVNSPDVVIPSWVRDVAGFWCGDEIDDSSFIEAIQYLIDNDVIIVPTTASSGSGTQEIPNWIKNNACWWAQGLISNSDFASGLQYLIGQGIIKI